MESDVENVRELHLCLDLIKEWVCDPIWSGKDLTETANLDLVATAIAQEGQGVKDLKSWLQKKNERYLHHWFSSRYQQAGRNPLIHRRFHPELPSFKEVFRALEDARYRKKAEDMANKKVDQEEGSDEEIPLHRIQKVNAFKYSPPGKGSSSFTDFALGEYETPHTLIEFKWNVLYHEWAFDFFKLLDRRIGSPNRIFLGVRPREINSGGGDRALNEYLKLVLAQVKQEDPNPLHGAKVVLIDLQFRHSSSSKAKKELAEHGPYFGLRICRLHASPQNPYPDVEWKKIDPWGPAISREMDSLKAYFTDDHLVDNPKSSST